MHVYMYVRKFTHEIANTSVAVHYTPISVFSPVGTPVLIRTVNDSYA